MRPFRFQADLERAIVDGFAWPLGVEPTSVAAAPRQGYLVDYRPGEGDEPDTYSFNIVVSHERIGPLVRSAFTLLGPEVAGVVEIGSRDAYRSVDTFLSREVIDRETFNEAWQQYESLMLEDVSIGAGAYQDEPYLEVFVDWLKVINIFTAMSKRDAVEQLLRDAGLDELDELDAAALEAAQPRTVLEHLDEFSPDVDELLVSLREAWALELDIDPDRNVDDGGRELGKTLWSVVAIVFRPAESPAEDDIAYAICWLTASSLREAQQIAADAIDASDWHFDEFYSTDRVAFDERPDELAELAPRRTDSGLHQMQIDPWTSDDPVADRGQDNA